MPKPLTMGTFLIPFPSYYIIRKEKANMKTSRLILVLASLGSMLISIIPALVKSNRRLVVKQELEQRLDVFGKR
jgi:hypothetical protein